MIGSITAGRFPMGQAFPASEYYQPVRLPVNHRAILALRACSALRLAPNPPGLPRSHKTTWQHAAGPGPRRRQQRLAVDDAADSAFPFERQGRPPHDRSISGLLLSLALRPVTSLFTLRDNCSRPHPAHGRSACPAKLGSRLLARLYQGDHCRPLGFVRLAAHLPQIRTCGPTAYGSSDHGFAGASSDGVSSRGCGTGNRSSNRLN